MYGFRPNRGCHNAIKELYKSLNNTKICYIVDADIKGFFDHMKHEWIIKFLHLYIKDPNIIGLVKKYLKVGGIIELVYIVLQSVVKPGITGFFKIDLHIKCYIYLS